MTLLLSLPDEIILNLCGLLDAKSLTSLSAVNARLDSISKDEIFWRKRIHRQLSDELIKTKPIGMSYRELCIGYETGLIYQVDVYTSDLDTHSQKRVFGILTFPKDTIGKLLTRTLELFSAEPDLVIFKKDSPGYQYFISNDDFLRQQFNHCRHFLRPQTGKLESILVIYK